LIGSDIVATDMSAPAGAGPEGSVATGTSPATPVVFAGIHGVTPVRLVRSRKTP
jgi:hypothetical protein